MAEGRADVFFEDRSVAIEEGVLVDHFDAYERHVYEFRRSIGTAVPREGAGSASSESLNLGLGYPNPFNSTAVIRFALPEQTDAELSVHNLGGQRVVTLSDGTHAAGSHQVSWDGRDERGEMLSSGVYLYRLRAGEQTLARKLLLLR